MRIVMICYNLFEKGTYWRAYYLAKSLVSLGEEVTLLATSPKNKINLESFKLDGVNIVLFPDLLSGSLRSGWDLYNSIRRILWFRNKRFDFVYGFDSRPTVFFLILWAKAHGAKILLDWSDWLGKGGSIEERQNKWLKSFLRPFETFFENYGRKLANYQTVICTTLKDKAIALGGKPQHIYILRNGSDIHNFYPKDMSDLRSSLNLPAGAFISGYVGTIFHRDALLMADVINALQEADPLKYFLICGYFPYDIKRLLRFPEKVVVLGPVSKQELNEFLNLSDILWLPMNDSPANRGRFPLKATDYLALAKPLLVSDVGDLGCLFNSSEIGILSAPTKEGLKKNIELMAADKQRFLDWGKNARALAENSYSWDKIAAELRNIIYTIINEEK